MEWKFTRSKLKKITIIATGKYLHSTKYEFDNGMHCFEGIYPDWDKRMFENKYYFERWYNEFGSHGNILT
jgi:hypothetical protein|nr:MAG: hypothetical protein [Bacteriophage sp.]